jgi:hypothetical protein
MKRWMLLLLLLCAWGCLPYYQNKVWEPKPPADITPGSFPGIDSPYLAAVDPESSIGMKPVKIFIVHGMGDQEVDFASKTIKRLATRLDLTKIGYRDLPIERAWQLGIDYGSVHVDVFDRSGEKVEIFSLHWAPLTKALEKKYVEYDWSGPTHRRAWLDQSLKKNLIDRSFTDAFLYAGPFHEHMQYSLKQGLCAVMTETESLKKDCDWSKLAPPARIHIITHSLGSILLLESLGEMAEAKGVEGEAAMELIARTRMVALLANQFPLFRLARTKDPESLLRGMPFLKGDFERLFAKRPEFGPKLAVVAFSDPNDLLSFAVPDDWQTGLLSQFRPYARFINVAVNNTYPFLGIVAHPDSAHTGYWTNDWILDLLVDGYPPRKR